MYTDRKKICEIISSMLDNPDKNGLYQTSTCYTKLEHYIECVRMEALGWAHADACCALDRGEDPRTMGVPDMIKRAMLDLVLRP